MNAKKREILDLIIGDLTPFDLVCYFKNKHNLSLKDAKKKVDELAEYFYITRRPYQYYGQTGKEFYEKMLEKEEARKNQFFKESVINKKEHVKEVN
tara:strand:+ start:1074 stop:1361 length:288 start_codon:yes stop_codon:yes gene_type:complete